MADTYELALSLRKNGSMVQGFNPLVKRLTVDQSQAFDERLASGGGDVSLPIAQVGTVSFLLLQGDQIETLKLGNMTTAAGWFVLAWNATPATETINNASGNTAINKGLAGGT